MVYLEKFVAVVKCNGKILREHDGVVQLPFGSEYSILLKNLSNRNALVNITIDGREVTGGGLIIPHTFKNVVELERFVDTGDLSKGYRFRFIQKTKEIQEHRGDKVDDGLIRIEWWFEEEDIYWRKKSIMPDYYFGTPLRNARVGSSATYSSSMECNSLSRSCDVFACSAAPMPSAGVGDIDVDDSPLQDEGITVEGSDSNQKFTYGHIGRLEPESHVVIFQLKGQTEEAAKPVQKPVYVDTRVQCKQCGKRWNSSQKFCGGCGSRLIL